MNTKRFIQIPQRGSNPQTELYFEYHQSKDKNNSKLPTIICLPGGPGGGMYFYKEYQLETLLQFADVLLFDPRGCGNSQKCSKIEYDMDTYIDDIDAILEHFNFKNCILIGTSYGSTVAQGYITKYGSKKLSGLILVNGASSHSFFDDAAKNLEQYGTSVQIEMFSRLMAGDITTSNALNEFYSAMWGLYTKKSHEIQAPSVDSDLPALLLNAGFKPGGFLRTFNFLPKLNRISLPTIIIVGDSDWITPLSCANETHSAIHNSQLEVIKDCAHFVCIDQPKKYFRIIQKFTKKNKELENHDV